MNDPNPAPEDRGAAPDTEAIQRQLARILSSPTFANAPSQERMLRFVVEKTLAGEAGRLKEYTLGVEVFGRGNDFDPRQDTIVRVQGRRLRDRMDDYYREQGSSDPVGIDLPKGGYVPTFHWRNVPSASASDTPASAERLPGKARPRLMTALALAALVSLAFAATVWLRAPTPRPSPESTSATTPPSLAVLPFVDLSQAHDQEYLADGLAEEILDQLAQVPALQVIGRTSSFSFRGRNEDLRDIGKKLGVTHLLEGSVRSDGGQLRVTAQLIRADDGSHSWSKSYTRALRDVFAVQNDIARDVAQALSVKLDAVTLNRAQGGTTNVDAYDRYLRWRSLRFAERVGVEDARQRVQLTREAVALDPRFVLAWDALADSLRYLADFVDAAGAVQARAEAEEIHARIAMLAPDSWVVKRARAYRLWREGKRAESIAVAREIMESGPLTVERAYPYIDLIFAVGHLNEGVALADRVKAIEPLAMYLSRDQQWNLTAARRYEEAEAEYQRSKTLDGNHDQPNSIAFGRMLARKDADPKALRERYAQLAKPRDRPFLGDFGAALHDREAMRAILNKAAADPAYGGVQGGHRFFADALGDVDLAVADLRRFFESRDGFKEHRMDHVSYWQFWIIPYSNLRSHPEFKKLLIETGVVDYWRQTGKWGDGCMPAGKDDFECK